MRNLATIKEFAGRQLSKVLPIVAPTGLMGLLFVVGAGRPGLAAPALPIIPAGIFYVTNYGAIGDGVFTNSTAFQAAFDDASSHGGGTVEVTAPGVYLCGPLGMHSNTRFKIDAGATVRLLPYGQYPGDPTESQSDAFIEMDRHGSNFEFCGPGQLDGQGKPWWDAKLAASQRPYELHMRDVSTVFIHDWSSTNPPMKHIVMDGENDNITIQNATNQAPYLSPSQNTDCINLLGTHCLVKDCVLSGCDDNIAMGRSTGECIDILITNVTCGTGHGISFGSLLPAGGVSNVTVINCTFSGTDNGIRLKSDVDLANGCVVRNVKFLNIGMTNVTRPLIIYSYYTEDGSPDSITPAIAAGMAISPPGSDLPIWRDILISNVWGTAASGSKEVGIVWGRTEMLVSNVTFQNINLTARSTFNIYNARGIQFVDCKFTPFSGSFPTYTAYNADVIITNTTAPGLRPVYLDGMTFSTNQTSNTFSFYNAQVGLAKTNLLGPPAAITIGGSLLVITNHLELPASSNTKFLLGTIPSTIGVRSNLTVGGTFRIADGGGFTNGSYVLFTNGGTLTWNNPSLLSTPPGSTCSFDTNTPGQVRLLVTFPAAPAITNQPQNVTTAAGATASFNVGATGTPLPAYQWLFNGTNISGAALSSLSLANVQLTDAGTYTVVVTNSAGAVTSAPAILSVLVPPVILGQQFGGSGFQLNFTGPAGQTYKVLASTNVSLTITQWLVLTNGAFPVSDPFIDATATNDNVKFYRVVSP